MTADDILKILTGATPIILAFFTYLTIKANASAKAAADAAVVRDEAAARTRDEQGKKLDDIGVKTDGLASRLADAKLKEGYATGVRVTTDTAAAVAMQQSMLRAAVAEGIAEWMAKQGATVAHPDLAPVASAIGGLTQAIQDTGEDSNMRVRDIQATINPPHQAAQEGFPV